MSSSSSGRVWAGRRVTRPPGGRTGHPYKCAVCKRTFSYSHHYKNHLIRKHPELADDQGPDHGNGPDPDDEDMQDGSPAAFYDWDRMPGTDDADFPDLVSMGAFKSVVNEFKASMAFITQFSGPTLKLVTTNTAVNYEPLEELELIAAAHKERHFARFSWPNAFYVFSWPVD